MIFSLTYSLTHSVRQSPYVTPERTHEKQHLYMHVMIRCQEYFINFLLKTLAIPTPTIRGSFSNMYSPAAKGYKSMQNLKILKFQKKYSNIWTLSVKRLETKNLQKQG